MPFAARGTRRRVLALIAGALAVAACSRQEAPPPPAPVPVTVVTAVARDMPVLVSAVGNVEPINSVAVTSMIDGQLLDVLVKDGEFVKTNQLLFRIDPRPAQAALRQSQAALTRDQAALAQARSEVKRNAPVAAKGYVSANQMEQLQTNVEAAAASVKVDQANLMAVKVTLGYTDIRAPIAGRIGRVLIQPGNLLKANDTKALVVINQIEPIYVNFALPAAMLGRTLVAQQKAPLDVAATIKGVTGMLEGQVAFVDNAVDTTTGTIRLRAQFTNTEHVLWPGQQVGVQLTLGHDADAVVVPDRVVQNGPDGTYAFVVKADRRAEQRHVTVARVVDGQAVIGSGLATGEVVVLDGQSRVESGVALKVTQASPASGPTELAPTGTAESHP